MWRQDAHIVMSRHSLIRGSSVLSSRHAKSGSVLGVFNVDLINVQIFWNMHVSSQRCYSMRKLLRKGGSSVFSKRRIIIKSHFHFLTCGAWIATKIDSIVIILPFCKSDNLLPRHLRPSVCVLCERPPPLERENITKKLCKLYFFLFFYFFIYW